jgi:hypothetical protein
VVVQGFGPPPAGEPSVFHQPLGFVDTLVLLTLASAIGMVLATLATAVWLFI